MDIFRSANADIHKHTIFLHEVKDFSFIYRNEKKYELKGDPTATSRDNSGIAWAPI